MNTTELLELQKAIYKIQIVLDGRCGDHSPRLWDDPSDITTPTGVPGARARRVSDADEAARERAAINFCLTSAIVLLGVAQRLMSTPTNLSPKTRLERLRTLTADLRTAAQAAYSAGLLLLNLDPCLPWSAQFGEG